MSRCLAPCTLIKMLPSYELNEIIMKIIKLFSTMYSYLFVLQLLYESAQLVCSDKLMHAFE